MAVSVLANAIITALGYLTGDRIANADKLAKALASARSGDANQLNSLVSQAQALRGTDGQFVNTCSDALNRPPRPGPGTRRRVGQDLPAVRHGGGTESGEVPELAQRVGTQGPEGPQDQRTAAGRQNDPIVGSQGCPPWPRRSSTPAPPAGG